MQHRGVFGRQRVAPRVQVGVRVVHLEEPDRRLLLAPLAGVALRDAGAVGQLAGGAVLAGEGAVQTEPVARGRSSRLQRPDRPETDSVNSSVVAATACSFRSGAASIPPPRETQQPTGRGPRETPARPLRLDALAPGSYIGLREMRTG